MTFELMRGFTEAVRIQKCLKRLTDNPEAVTLTRIVKRSTSGCSTQEWTAILHHENINRCVCNLT